jgi:glyceraldehyde-3-phosphate dehydrogenase (NADP+)
MKLAEIVRECGCPDGQVSVIVCPNDLAPRPIDDARVKHVSFTGSDKVGWQVKQRAWAKRCTLELGGNAAVIVHDDADLDAAVRPIAMGAFGYAGQSCISVQRIFTHENIYDRFRELMLGFIREKIRVGDPRDRATVVGPMIDQEAQQRVLSRIGEAERSGARILCGAEPRGRCITPTLIENADPKSPICQSEVFGPVATLHPYTSFDEAITLANDTPFGLQAGLFTRDLSRAWDAFESLEVGGVMINQVPTWRVETMPYGGVKQSGFGREGIRYAMQEMTEPRVLVMRMK